MNIIGTMTKAEIENRHQEKCILILVWLARYSFSTVSIIAIMLNIDERNARSTLQKLVAAKLLKTVNG